MDDHNLLFKNLRKEIALEVSSNSVVHIYATRLMDVGPDSVVVIAPQEEGHIVTIDSGSRVKLIITEGSVVFTFDSMVLGVAIKDDVPLLNLQRPFRMETIQRRNNFRVPTAEFDVMITALGGATEPFKGVCKEVSGGGMMIVTDYEFASGDGLGITFTLRDEPEQFSVMGEIKRIENLRRGNIAEFRYGVFFTNISDRMREKIIKYTFRQQRKLIQRGLL